MPGSRRTMMIRDRKRNSTSRKRTHKEMIVRQKQQAAVVQRLIEQARAEAKAANQ